MTGIGPLLMMAVFMLAIIFGFSTIANRVYNFHKDQRRFKRTLRKAPILTVGDFADGTEAKLVGKVRLLAEIRSPPSPVALAPTITSG